MFEKLTDCTYALTDGSTIGNVGVVATNKGTIIIDTSMYPKIAYKIRKELDRMRSGNVQAAIFTHYHFDHTGGAQHFHDVPRYAHELVKDNFTTSYNQEDLMKNFANGDQADLFEGLEVTAPDRLFKDSPYYITENSDISLYHTGGHTSGSTIIYYKPDNVVFAGDNILSNRYPWGGDPTASPYDWLNSINKILELNPKVVVPGHGDVCYNLQEVEKYGEYLVKVFNLSKNLLQDSVEDEKLIEELMNLDFNEEAREGLKKNTLTHWIKVIREKETS